MSVQIPVPQCMKCKWWRPGEDHPLGLQTCPAFPDGIPDEIWTNEKLHDSGPEPHFEAKEGVDMEKWHRARNLAHAARWQTAHPEMFEEEPDSDPDTGMPTGVPL